MKRQSRQERILQKASKPGEMVSLPKTWLVGSLVILAFSSSYHLPTATAWMPLTRTTPCVESQRLAFLGTPQSPAFVVLPSQKQSRISMWHAKKPSDDEDEEFEWDEIDFEEEIEFDEDEDFVDDDEEADEDEDDVDDDDDDEIDEDYVFEDEEDDDDGMEEAEEEDDEILDDEDIIRAKELKKEAGWDEEEEEETEEEEAEEVEAEEEQTLAAGEEWDEDEGEYPLEDDPNDPNYQKQKELLELALSESDRVGRNRNFDALNFMMNEMTDEMMAAMDEMPFQKEAEERAKNILLSVEDVDGIDLEKELKETTHLMDDDPYPRHEEGEVNLLEESIGITDDEMEAVDQSWKMMKHKLAEQSWDLVSDRELAQKRFEGLSNETLEEMEEAWDELGGASYNVTQYFLYDLEFNVTNLMLAAVKHNRESPILFAHWYPQLVTYSRYKDAQDRDFDFTWEDVENADLSELERYYKGMGYDEIPTKPPSETGIIEFDYLDEEEIKMAAFEEWIKDVYNPEWDKKDFDDDDIRDEDNVFSDEFLHREHPDVPTFETAEDDVEDWIDELNEIDSNEGDEEEGQDGQTKKEVVLDEESKSYFDFIVQDTKYDKVEDKEFEEEFRGHLIVACTADDSDLEIAEKITLAMDKAFGKQVYVETQVVAHAREDDNVFEVWLESYEIELLHSKKRATSNTKDWYGPAVCDDKQVEYLVDKVGFLISDDSRYSYSFECDGVV